MPRRGMGHTSSAALMITATSPPTDAFRAAPSGADRLALEQRLIKGMPSRRVSCASTGTAPVPTSKKVESEKTREDPASAAELLVQN